MQRIDLTCSENLFEQFCSQLGLLVSRVDEATSRRPDYRMIFPATDVIVEIKEINPTAEERAVIETDPDIVEPEKLYHWGIPGERVRKKISNAVPQLKALSKSTLPTLLVLHDPIRFWPELLDADALKVAMYGVETILISPESAHEGGATILERWHGSRRRFTSDHNTSLSAIGILELEDGHISLQIFHNWYARAPLSPSLLSYTGITHFQLAKPPTEGYPAWVSIS